MSPDDRRTSHGTRKADVRVDPPRRRATGAQAFAALVFVVSSGVIYAAFVATTRRQPSRGYTVLGTTLGILALVCFLVAWLYSLRKRAGQEWMPGRLQTWLQLHLWISLLGTVAALLHSGLHFDGGVGTIALVVLSVVVVTGLGGWFFYVTLPPVVRARVGNLAIPGVEQRRNDLSARLDDLAAGDRSVAFRSQYAVIVEAPATKASGALRAGEKEKLEEAHRLADGVRDLDARLRTQRRLGAWLRGWLWIHVPAAFLLVPAVLWHVYDAEEWVWNVRHVRPDDYADPKSCARCHQTQFEEWASSAHAVAMSSPVMELQTRLVELKERELLKDKDRPLGQPIVGNLCVRCHAPTGYPKSNPNPSAAEETLALANERAPASRTGVSCVACHQVNALHPSPFDPAAVRNARIEDFQKAFPGGILPDGSVVTLENAVLGPDRKRDPTFGIAFKNIENFEWTQGRRIFGPFGTGKAGDHPSVGNDAHRGEGMEEMRHPEFCASCHTVVVDDPNQQGKRIVTLQNTYGEWRDLGDVGVRWGDDPGPARSGEVHCMQCHSMDLTSIATFAASGEARQLSIEDLRRDVRSRLVGLELAQADTFAASHPDGFDQSLPPGRRRFLHRFVGVDHHLGAPAAERDEAALWTQQLLKIAAAVRIRELTPDGTLLVDVHNLATGHNLPAGFAFAREMWVEVAVATTARGAAPPPESSNDWIVVAGGRGGLPLASDAALDRSDETAFSRLRNFQAVLFNKNGTRDVLDFRADGKSGAEVVLQNLTTDVLKGAKAREAGFLDRVGPIGPGGVEALTIPLGVSGPGWNRETITFVRARLRFRSLPPEFLERLARSFMSLRDGNEPRNADRARALIGELRIVEMAADIGRLR